MKYSVYVLLKDLKPIYIGQTSNIKQRLKSHKNKGFTDHIIIETFDNRRDALISERGIIKYLSCFENWNNINAKYARFKNTMIIKKMMYGK